MPEEPDDGRKSNRESVVREQRWPELTPVARPIDDEELASNADVDSPVSDANNDDSVETDEFIQEDEDDISSSDDTVNSGNTLTSDDTEGHDAVEDSDVDFVDDSTDESADSVDYSTGSADSTEFTDSADDSADDDEWSWSYEDLDNIGPPELERAEMEDSDEIEPGYRPVDVDSSATETDNAYESDDGVMETDGAVLDAETMPDPTTGFGGSGPETDVEQPLAVHVEEMVKRLAIVIAVAGLVSVAVFPLTEELINIIWNHVLPGVEAIDPRLYHPLALILTQIKVASLAGLIIALPVFVYESYVFMRPGLYKKERRYYLAAVPTSLVLAVLGVVFSYFIILPYTMAYFQKYTKGTAAVAFALGSTFDLILVIMGYLAVVFQIPLFIMLAIMLNVVTRQWMEERRLLFWGAFAGIAFAFISVDPTGIVPIIVAVTMIALFEGTLALLRWTGN